MFGLHFSKLNPKCCTWGSPSKVQNFQQECCVLITNKYMNAAHCSKHECLCYIMHITKHNSSKLKNMICKWVQNVGCQFSMMASQVLFLKTIKQHQCKFNVDCHNWSGHPLSALHRQADLVGLNLLPSCFMYSIIRVWPQYFFLATHPYCYIRADK